MATQPLRRDPVVGENLTDESGACCSVAPTNPTGEGPRGRQAALLDLSPAREPDAPRVMPQESRRDPAAFFGRLVVATVVGG